MRRSIPTLLTTLLISTAILPVAAYAQTTVAAPTSLNPSVTNQVKANQVNPFNLAYLAYQGYLEDQGIPSAGALIDAIAVGTVTAQDLMQAAVKANRLPEKTLNDQGYRFALENQLQAFTTD
jgi:hypothetical protein